MKIIPKNADATALPFALPADYAGFMARYGGGWVFPNHVKITDPEFVDITGYDIAAVQYFLDPERLMNDLDTARETNAYPDGFIPVAAIHTGDVVLMALTVDPALNAPNGSIWIWPRNMDLEWGDAANNRIFPIAASFSALLNGFYFEEDEGMPPPWRRMASPDDAPAIDLIL